MIDLKYGDTREKEIIEPGNLPRLSSNTGLYIVRGCCGFCSSNRKFERIDNAVMARKNMKGSGVRSTTVRENVRRSVAKIKEVPTL